MSEHTTGSLGEPIPLSGTPTGLVAYVRPRPDGTLAKDRRGRVKATKVTVARAPDPDPTGSLGVFPGDPVPGISGADLAWVVRLGQRRWPSVTTRFGSAATDIAFRLARAGVVRLLCVVTDDATLGEVLGWTLDPAWEADRVARQERRSERVESWTDRAHVAADRVEVADPALADALRAAHGGSPLLPVLVHAAEDLVAGVSHDGPRAFSQTHFGDSKERDDAPQILTNAGVGSDTLVRLGLQRSPYLGLAGPVTVTSAAGAWHLRGAAGPTQFRLAADKPIQARLTDPAPILLVIENKQAAEATSDAFPDTPVLYCAGQPSDAALAVLTDLAADAAEVVIATDADLGGVRITERLLTAITDPHRITVVDVGTVPHTRGEPFGEVSRQGLTALAPDTGPVGLFAQACLDRGYRVEQEAAIRAALTVALSSAAPAAASQIPDAT